MTRKKLDADNVQLTLAGEMNIYSIKNLKKVLLQELGNVRGLSLDLAGVDDADTSAFQLLLFLKREAEAAGKDFSITELGDRLKSLTALYKEIF